MDARKIKSLSIGIAITAGLCLGVHVSIPVLFQGHDENSRDAHKTEPLDESVPMMSSLSSDFEPTGARRSYAS